MAKVTRIKASDGPREAEKEPAGKSTTVVRKKVSVSDKKTEKSKVAARRAAEKKVGQAEKQKQEKGKKKPFWLFRPFVALGNYFKGAWGELRQVRWPDRKTTWKMVLAVILYSLLFMVIITLLDLFFSWLFNLILNR